MLDSCSAERLRTLLILSRSRKCLSANHARVDEARPAKIQRCDSGLSIPEEVEMSGEKKDSLARAQKRLLYPEEVLVRSVIS
jgi:hypothetical protein